MYFLSRAKVQPARRVVDAPAVARSSLDALLQGPSAAERRAGLTSALPAGVQLRSVALAQGTAVVDLSPAFSAAPQAQQRKGAAQVVYTLTQVPSVSRVSLQVGGTALMGFQSTTRASLSALAPDVLVESPRWGEPVTSPLRVTGTADVFEAVFFLELRAASGALLARERVQASSGTGTRGTFAATLAFRASGPVSLVAYVLSPKDGARVVVATVPLAA